MTSAQLRFLTVFAYLSTISPTRVSAREGLTLEFLSDGLEKTLIALPRVLLERGDEGVGHCSCRCSLFLGIGALTLAFPKRLGSGGYQKDWIRVTDGGGSNKRSRGSRIRGKKGQGGGKEENPQSDYLYIHST